MMVEVTQADREAAWAICPDGFSKSEYADWQNGVYDGGSSIQALAKHRESSVAELQARLDKAVEALQEVDDTLEKLSGSLAELDAALFAQEIAVIAQDRESIAAIKGPSHE